MLTEEDRSLACMEIKFKLYCHFEYLVIYFLFVFGVTAPTQWARASSFTRLLHHTQRRTTDGRNPLDE